MGSYRKLLVATTVALLCVAFVGVDLLSADDWDDFSASVRSAKRRYDKTAEDAIEDRDDALKDATDDYDDGKETAGTALLKAFTDGIKVADDDGDTEMEKLLLDSKKEIDELLFPKERSVKDILEGTWSGGSRDWTFKRNGTVSWKKSEDTEVVDTGRWKITDDGIQIVWNGTMWAGQSYWSFIHLPLDEAGTPVDEWSGINAFSLVKKVTRRNRDRDDDEEDDTEADDDATALTPADIDWEALPESIRDAKIDYEDAILALDEALATATTDAETNYLAELAEAYAKIETILDDAIETAEDRDDEDLAVDLDDAKYALETTSKGEELVVDYEEEILGVWVETKETARGDGYDGRWKFVFSKDENGRKRVTCSIKEQNYPRTGSWKVTDTHVIVTWSSYRYTGYYRSTYGSHKAWIALRLPLDEDGTVADSWSGLDAYVFEKVEVDD
jgi:hypothetical protein